MARNTPAPVDPLAAALDSAPVTRAGSHQFKLDVLFGDRPAVLASVIAAHQRGLGHATIAKILNSQSDERIAPTAVKSWLDANLPK